MGELLEKERGVWLTIWLILILIFNIFVISGYLFSILSGIQPSISLVTYVFIGLALLNIIFIIILFKWKTIGFFGYVVSSVIAFVINLVIGNGILSIPDLIGPVVLYLLLRSKWDYFE